MARTLDPAVMVQDQDNLIQGVANHFLQKVHGPDGMPCGTKFSELEEPAVQTDQAVSRSMINQALVNQAEHVPDTAETCGVCGAAVQSGPPPEPRAMTTTVGTARWSEPKRYCPKCRAAFFPSGPEFGDRPWHLQPSCAAADRLRRGPEHGGDCWCRFFFRRKKNRHQQSRSSHPTMWDTFNLDARPVDAGDNTDPALFLLLFFASTASPVGGRLSGGNADQNEHRRRDHRIASLLSWITGSPDQTRFRPGCYGNAGSLSIEPPVVTRGFLQAEF